MSLPQCAQLPSFAKMADLISLDVSMARGCSQLAGTMTCGISEENGGRQDLTFDTQPGQAFVVPQGGTGIVEA